MPKVLNYKISGFPHDAVNIMRGHKYGNHYKIGQKHPYIFDKVMDRDDVCYLYEVYADKTFTDEEIMYDLRGKNLVCCCKPLRCHGDYLLKRANKRKKA